MDYYQPRRQVHSNDNRVLFGVLHRTKWWSNCAAGTAIFAIIAVAGVAVLAAIALNSARHKDRLQTFTTSTEINNTPYKVRLDGAGPLAMTLPNDLSGFVGATYFITAGTAQIHTVTISPGPLTTTFDGVNTIATFGGAVGDGIEMEVISKDRIVIFGNVNVAFS